VANSRIPGGKAVAILGAAGVWLGLSGPVVKTAEAKPPIVLAGDPIPVPPTPAVEPVANPPTVTAILPPQPAHKVAAAAKPAPAPAHAQTRPLIPPAAVPGDLTPPPQPREPLPLQTDLLPMSAPPVVAAPSPKPPAS
jgi:hypothetical protein